MSDDSLVPKLRYFTFSPIREVYHVNRCCSMLHEQEEWGYVFAKAAPLRQRFKSSCFVAPGTCAWMEISCTHPYLWMSSCASDTFTPLSFRSLSRQKPHTRTKALHKNEFKPAQTQSSAEFSCRIASLKKTLQFVSFDTVFIFIVAARIHILNKRLGEKGERTNI